MAPDITEATNLLLEDKIWSAVQHHIAYYHAPEVNVFPTRSEWHRVHNCYSCAAQIVLVHMMNSGFD